VLHGCNRKYYITTVFFHAVQIKESCGSCIATQRSDMLQVLTCLRTWDRQTPETEPAITSHPVVSTALQEKCVTLYSKTCLKRTPYIPETWTNGK